jgi:hypothetical protein
VVPFNAITLPFTLHEILQVARLHSLKTCKEVQRVPLDAMQLRVSSSSALRVAYLSADFRHIHPVGRDLAAILPRHTHRFPVHVCFEYVALCVLSLAHRHWSVPLSRQNNTRAG